VQAVILGGVAWNTMIDVERFPEPNPQAVFAKGMHQAIGASGAGKALNLAARAGLQQCRPGSTRTAWPSGSCSGSRTANG